MSNTLFTPTTLGRLQLKNRVVMAPMTRSRATDNVPNELMEKYYQLRAGAGLIITEGTSPSANGLGYARIPGMFSDAQVQGWKRVNDAVHKAGGKIFIQLMHTGRVSHPANMQPGTRILAPSALAAPGEMWTDSSGMQPHPAPAEMSEADIEHAIAEYASASKRAIEAGFDGVELHAANGYLIDQFLNTATNQRTDKWGGSVENRVRFATEVAKATVAAIGAERVGMRISPYGAFNGTVSDAKMDALYLRLIEELNKLGLVYIHIVDHSSMGAPEVSPELKAKIRANFKGKYILSGGYDLARANTDLEAQRGDLVAFGRPFISNPDLVHKLQNGTALTAPDSSTFYTPGEKGYTDY
ncbi:alkene reductase [Sideroxydans lithotrophicus]|uniref:NADH:flavin oxidoreductase/NADH oxidase n=1 Tax=Sideroxydans lithotrophicus (strain ES-1) TaxID=580332 RepID=D5CRJ8_SIDLE|nr:alkene reductase [Sideroxydans lithotrophicus]ADE11584.1 NADH:flavin oxidoreductase/NADH oxidase [Sideroxydans lithotrophicus ES-1]